MPDNELTLKDIWEKQVRIEYMLAEILAKLSTLSEGDIIEGVEYDTSPFLNPETGLYDMKYYRSQHPKDEGDK